MESKFKIGDIVYYAAPIKKMVTKHEIKDIRHHIRCGYRYYCEEKDKNFYENYAERNYFKTKQEAYKRLEELIKMSEKKELLMKYEEKLNKEMGISQKYIK